MTNKLGMDDNHYNYKHMQGGEDIYATLSSPLQSIQCQGRMLGLI